MLIENQWVVHDDSEDTYFAGLRDITNPEGEPIRDLETGDVKQAPIMDALNSRVRTYKNERGAKQAVRKIIDASIGDHTVSRNFEVIYIERQEVPDVPEDPKDNTPDKPEPQKFTEVKDPEGWYEVYGFAFPLESLITLRSLDGNIRASETFKQLKYCKGSIAVGDFSAIKLCRKVVGDREMFGVIAADGKLYSAGIGGGAAALDKFCDECRKFLMPRVTRGDERICPVCGAKNPHFVRMCPKLGKDICETHCNEGCEYFSGYDTTVVQCYFSSKQKSDK